MKEFAAALISADEVGIPKGAGTDATITSILTTVYIWAGIICVIVIIIGAIRYITSSGDASGVQSGKNTIVYGVIGMIVIMSAAGITQFIGSRF